MNPISHAGAMLTVWLVAAGVVGAPGDAGLSYNCTSKTVGGIKGVNCRGRGLTDVPPDIPTNLQSLDLSDNNLTRLGEQFRVSGGCEASHRHACSRFPKVVYLKISSNLLANLSSGCFLGMKDLAYLHLQNNLLETIPWDLFQDNRLLETINLSRNRLVSLPPEVFRDLGNLHRLNIDGNCLRYLPEGLLWQLGMLTHFTAAHNQLTGLGQKTFADNSKLRFVDLSHNFIELLSRYVFLTLTRLDEVNLSVNRLESVYLSYIPVSLSDSGNFSVIDPETGLCTGLVHNIPCFMPDSTRSVAPNKGIFHEINYSFNNISNIIFSRSNKTPSIEFSTLHLAGNTRISLPISFIKQEKYIISLDLSGSYLSWRNLTLFNEIFELEHLKSITLVGCEACEHFTRELLFSIFNTHLRVLLTCSDEHAHNATLASGSTVLESQGGCPRVGSEDTALGYNVTGYEVENIAVISNSDLSCPCDYIGSQTMWYMDVQSGDYIVNCLNLIDCSYLSLSHLPEMRPSSCFLLLHNNIGDIEPHYFDNWSELKSLDLSFNDLHNLSTNVFDALENLVALKVSNNYITSINSTVFTRLTKLEFLNLNGNPMSSYTPDVFATLKQLKVLTVDFANFTQFHDDMFKNLSALSGLFLHETTNTVYPTATLTGEYFKNCSALKYLSIVGFKLNLTSNDTFLHSNDIEGLSFRNCILQNLSVGLITTSTNITALHFKASSIQNVYENAFVNLGKLEFLDLSMNLINFLHGNVFLSTHELVGLNISDNQLVYIPPKIFDSLVHLAVLDLSHNMLISLDYSVFSRLISLQELDFQHAARMTAATLIVEKFHPCVPQDVNLSNMTISHYNIISYCDNYTYIVANAFGNNLRLNVLLLAYNRIDKIHDEAFTHNGNITHLSLNHNSLTSINNKVFRNLTKLRLLVLSNNKISSIGDGAFQGLLSLELIFLNWNRLTSFDSSVLPGSTVLQNLFLNDNLISAANLTLNFQSVGTVYLTNNPLTDISTTLRHLPRIQVLELQNTDLSLLDPDTFRDSSHLTTLNLGGNSLAGLTPEHFSHLPELAMLNLSHPGSAGGPEDAGGVSWRNMTLINHWFEMPILQFIILTGNSVCEQAQWTQVLQGLFLSETWKVVMCSSECKLPPYYAADGFTITFQ